MTSHIPRYSESSGYQEDAVKMKRFMGIILASVFLLFATSKSRLSGSNTHPAVHERWLRTVKSLDLPSNDYLWLYFGSLSLAILQNIGISVPDKKVEDLRSFCLDIIEDLKNNI